MASKDIDKFLAEVADLGIEVCENTVRRKLKTIRKSPKDLRNPLVRSFVIALLSPNTDKLIFDMYSEALEQREKLLEQRDLLRLKVSAVRNGLETPEGEHAILLEDVERSLLGIDHFELF